MNEFKCKYLLQAVMECDRVITEQQLGKNWIPTDLSFLENEGPIVSEKSKTQSVSANPVLKEALTNVSRLID